MRPLVLLAAALAAALAACAPDGRLAGPDAGAPARLRDVGAAARFETWMQPRLDAVETMLEASQLGVEFVALVLRAREPGAGAPPPPAAAAMAGIAQAEARAGQRLAGLASLPEGDAEQVALAADAEDQAARMRASLAAFGAALPRLAEIGGALGPLRPDENAALSDALLRLLDLQVRADMVFADLVMGLLTPDSDALPERELQSARWRGNAILLRALDARRAGAGMAAPQAADLAAAIAGRRRDLDAAARKVDALRDAATALPRFQTAALGRVIRSYEAGLDAEEEFLAAIDALPPVDAAGDRLAGAFDGVRRLMDRLVHRLRVNIDRLRMLGDIGGGRRA